MTATRDEITRRLEAKRLEWLGYVSTEDREHENAAMTQINYELEKLHDLTGDQ